MKNPTPSSWSAMDDYITSHLVPADPILSAALQTSDDANLPEIQVAPSHGKLLQVLARGCGARRILEVGTLGGYSTIWLGRALPADGHLVTLEIDPKHAEVARTNLARAGLADRAEVRVGAALDLLPALANEKPAPFDVSFIDANKDNAPEYFDWAVKLSRPGALVIVDNVVREGAVADPSCRDPYGLGIRRLYEAVGRDTRVTATAIQTLAGKGYDGMLIATVN